MGIPMNIGHTRWRRHCMDGGNSPIDLTDGEDDLFLEDNPGSNVHEYTGGNGKDVTSLVTFIIQSASFLHILYFI